MAGYAIQARIDGVRPRLSAPAAPAAPAARAVAEHDGPALEADQRADEPLATVPLDELTPTRGQGRERGERGRELWSQTTFFLFDPNSWR